MAEQEKKSDVFRVRPSKLIFDDNFNPREDFGNMDGLTEEIRVGGVKDPVTGYRSGEFIVVKSGHRRTIAAKRIEDEGGDIWVPVLLEPRHYNPENRVLDLLTDNGGLPFTPWEQAKVIQRLLAFGWTAKEISERSGKSLVYIRRLQLLASAPEKVINLVRKKVVSATLVIELMGEGKIGELLERAEKNQLPPLNPDLELFQQEEPVVKTPKITKGDLRPNSWKAFKKWSKDIDEKDLPTAKAKTFKFLKQMEAGELTEENFKEFFQ